MSDDEKREKRRILHTPAPDRRAPMPERVASLEEALKALVASMPNMISAGTLATGQKIYNEVAQQHARVFDVQEAAFTACLELLDARVCQLETDHGLAPGLVTTYRDVVEAVADYFGAVADSNGNLPAWRTLDGTGKTAVIVAYLEARDQRKGVQT